MKPLGLILFGLLFAASLFLAVEDEVRERQQKREGQNDCYAACNGNEGRRTAQGTCECLSVP